MLDWVGRGLGISNPIDGLAEQIYGTENILQQDQSMSMNHSRDVLLTAWFSPVRTNLLICHKERNKTNQEAQ